MPVVYCYHCITTGKKYVGVTDNEIRRKSQHKNNIKVDRYPDLAFYRAVKKYGWDSFIYGVIEHCPVSELNDKEVYWIETLNTLKNGYNMTIGGMRCTLTEEHKRKIGLAHKGKTISKEQREMISKRHKGKKLTEEHKERVSRGMERTYEITYASGEVELVIGMKRFCKERGYTPKGMWDVMSGKQRRHKDIVKVTKRG